jgi:hypothetical protein
MSKTSMMLEFRTIMQNAENKIQGVMHDSIDDFKNTVSEHAKSDVYPLYTPMRYFRRMDAGGLSDTANYEVTEGRLELTLNNKTKSGAPYGYSIDITDVVEEGNGYGWRDIPARPFMDKALEEFAHEILEPRIREALGGD